MLGTIGSHNYVKIFYFINNQQIYKKNKEQEAGMK